MSRPGTPVIPPGWEQHHRGVPEGAMTAQGVLSRPDMHGTYDPNTHTTSYDPPTRIWAGSCRVQEMRLARAEPEVGEQQVSPRRYLVSVPLACPLAMVGDRLDITSATDSNTVGLALRVLSIAAGSLLWDRELTCEAREAQN